MFGEMELMGREQNLEREGTHQLQGQKVMPVTPGTEKRRRQGELVTEFWVRRYGEEEG